jgi:RHS repeat-associated protein
MLFMSSESLEPVQSNAFNFGDFVAGGVDPRTGVYTCSLSLGTIHSAELNGPSFQLALSFNPLNLLNAGYGSGWSLSVTRYDMRSKVMTFSNGERYKAVESRDALYFKEMKLESARVLKIGNGQYEVRYKDGRREQLKVHGSTHIAVPERIIAANGVSISLKYKTINEQPMLVEISDFKRRLLNVVRTAARVTLTRYPDSPSSAEFSLTLNNDQAIAIGLPEGSGWDLQYRGSYLTRVVSPLGAVENIRYKEVGHLFPTVDGDQSLPCVIAHDIYARHGQPKVSKTYSYSDWNYLGHGVPADPSDDGDPLFRAGGNYRYSSEERLVVDNKIHTRIKRTYNKFHLLISEITICGSAQTSVETRYYCDVHQPFTQQPAQFRMPQSQTVTYENLTTKKKRSETSVTEYDAIGNLLKQVGSDGVTTLCEYYPVTETPDCPADPLGFVRFLKQKTMVPAAGGGASTVTRYRYASLPALEGSALASVVPVEECFFELVAEGEVLRSTVAMTYLVTPKDSITHGLVQQQKITRNDKVTRVEYSYTIDGFSLRLKKTLHGFDGTSSTTEQTLSTVSGLTLSERDVDDGVIEYEYDKLGRCVRKTLAGKEPVASYRWRYEAASADGPATVVLSDPSDGEQTTTHDALGRVIGIKEKDCDNPDAAGQSPIRTVYAALHDTTGRLSKQTRTDWWDGVAHPLTSHMFYDDWGEVRETRHADGRIMFSEFDPVSRQQKNWQQGMGKTVTVFNAFGKPDSTEVFDLKGQSLGKNVYEYDGLGRTISQTDPVGHTTRYTYDVHGRLFRSVLPDGHVLETEFAAHVDDALPVAISLAGKQLGLQVFDGLNRLTERSVGGRKSVAVYQAGRTQPQSHTNAAGETIEYVYSSEPGSALMERRALTDASLLTRFTYDRRNGKTRRCSEQGRETRFDYFPSGRLKSETTGSGEQSQVSSYSYSLAGRPLEFVDVLGARHTTGYDTWGRETLHRQGTAETRYFYGQSGLLERIETRDTASASQIITHLAYDDIGRELTRRIEVNDLPAQTLTSSYTFAGQLAQKVLKRGTDVLRDERFSYDARGRLSQYDCEGLQRPLDPYGKEVVQQTFTFDALDNILCVQTTFPQGVNVTTFSYSERDVTQLIGVRHSHADYPAPVTLEYDANGRMIKDDQARTLAYDALGRLTRIIDASGVERGYRYDGFDRLVELAQPRTPAVQRFYHGDKISSEISGTDSRSVVRHGSLVLGQQQLGADAGLRLFGVDQQQSVLTQLHREQSIDSAYSPYGHRSAEGGRFSQAGFNGEPLDEMTGLYFLGNGYRAYSPTLMRFISPDSMSPFDAGGLNAYAYCLCDPVNRVDPTGHVSWQSIAGVALGGLGIVASILTLGTATPLALLGVGLGIASGASAIGSAVAHELDPQSSAGEILGYISLGLGLASLGAGLAAQAIKGGNRLAGAFRSGLSGDAREAAKAMAKGMGGRSTQGTSAGSTRWTYKTYKYDSVRGTKSGKGAIPGFDELNDAERARFFRFKDAIVDEGMTPTEAAAQLGTKIKYREMIPFEYPNPKSLKDRNYFNHTGYTEIRLSGATRLFFYAHIDTRTVTMHSFGHTVKGG